GALGADAGAVPGSTERGVGRLQVGGPAPRVGVPVPDGGLPQAWQGLHGAAGLGRAGRNEGGRTLVTRARRIARNVVRIAAALVLSVSAVTAWTHFGNGTTAPRIGLSLSRDWYDRSELNPAATALALSRAGANVRNLDPGDLPQLDRSL